jgi:PBSX family phage terminase large subunit
MFILAGKSIGSLNRNVIRPLLQILTTWGLKYKINRSDNYLIVGNNTYYMFGANNESAQDLIQGLTAAGFYADEVTLFPKSFVDQAISRCSIENSKIFMNCNPGSPHHYIKEDFIDQHEERNIYHLHFLMEDNPSLSDQIKRRYERLFSGVFYQRYVLGEWVLAEGVIYDMFDKQKNTYTQLPQGDYKQIIGIDYGTSNPTTFLKLYISTKGSKPRVYIDDEYYFSGKDEGWSKTDAQYADDLESFIKGDKPHKIYVDPSAASFISELKYRNHNVIPADNDVLDGIRKCSTMFQNNTLKVNKEKCPHLLDELSEYSWDEKAQEKGEDKPLKINDHCVDAMRYGVFSELGHRAQFKTREDPVPTVI